MTLYEKNTGILQARFPGISRALGDLPQKPAPAEWKKTKDGLISLRYKGIWLHSTLAPLKEARRLIDSTIAPDTPFCLFYGFGLAYHLEYFIKRFPEIPFGVVIPDKALFRLSLSLRDFSRLLNTPRLSLALETSPQALPALFEGHTGRRFQICMLRSVLALYKEYFQSCDREIRSFWARKEINANTVDKFSRLWVSNICRNLPLSPWIPGVNNLKDHFSGFPALLLAAGPTLDEILPFLPELKKRMLLVCVDTALKACLRQGMEPDILILTDPQYWNSRHLDRCLTQKTLLISDVSTYPPALRHYHKRLFFCSTPFPLAQYYEKRTGLKGKLKSGGSVATAAWDFIRFCGIKTIYCGGLDLSFPDGQTHCKGSTFEERAHMYSSRFHPAATSAWLSYKGGNPFPGFNALGNRVFSDQRMKIYIRWFEEQLRNHREVRSIQLSPRGIKIKGMEWEKAETLKALPCCRDMMEKRLMEARLIPPPGGLPAFQQAHKTLVKELESLLRLTKKGAEISRALIHKGLEARGLAELNRIDKEIMNRESRQMAGFILSPVLEKQMEGPKGKSPEAIMQNSCALYRELHQSLHFHLEKIKTMDFSRTKP